MRTGQLIDYKVIMLRTSTFLHGGLSSPSDFCVPFSFHYTAALSLKLRETSINQSPLIRLKY